MTRSNELRRISSTTSSEHPVRFTLVNFTTVRLHRSNSTLVLYKDFATCRRTNSTKLIRPCQSNLIYMWVILFSFTGCIFENAFQNCSSVTVNESIWKPFLQKMPKSIKITSRKCRISTAYTKKAFKILIWDKSTVTTV